MSGVSVRGTLYCTLNKLGMSWAKLKFSSVRVVNEITDILHSVEIKIKVAVELLISLDLGLGLGLITKMCLNTTHPQPFQRVLGFLGV